MNATRWCSGGDTGRKERGAPRPLLQASASPWASGAPGPCETESLSLSLTWGVSEDSSGLLPTGSTRPPNLPSGVRASLRLSALGYKQLTDTVTRPTSWLPESQSQKRGCGPWLPSVPVSAWGRALPPSPMHCCPLTTFCSEFFPHKPQAPPASAHLLELSGSQVSSYSALGNCSLPSKPVAICVLRAP